MNLSVRGKKTKSPGHIHSGHWVRCMRCDFIVRNSDMVREWTGAIVCSDCVDKRNPQDFVRGKPDNMVAKGLVNPDSEMAGSSCTTNSALAGEAVAGCAIAGLGVSGSIIPSGSFNTNTM